MNRGAWKFAGELDGDRRRAAFGPTGSRAVTFSSTIRLAHRRQELRAALLAGARGFRFEELEDRPPQERFAWRIDRRIESHPFQRIHQRSQSGGHHEGAAAGEICSA